MFNNNNNARPKGHNMEHTIRKNNTKNIIMFFDQKVEDILFTKGIWMKWYSMTGANVE